MAYNRLNHLRKMRDIVEVYCREKKPGISTAYVYREFIYPQFHISLATLYVYLSTPIAKQIKEEENKKNKCFETTSI